MSFGGNFMLYEDGDNTGSDSTQQDDSNKQNGDDM